MRLRQGLERNQDLSPLRQSLLFCVIFVGPWGRMPWMTSGQGLEDEILLLANKNLSSDAFCGLSKSMLSCLCTPIISMNGFFSCLSQATCAVI
jgi:hypothetical protein